MRSRFCLSVKWTSTGGDDLEVVDEDDGARAGLADVARELGAEKVERGLVAALAEPKVAGVCAVALFCLGEDVSINGVTYDNVKMLDDLPCIFVPQSHMKTAVTVQTGSGNSSGIVPATGAQDINVLLAHCSAPLAVSKLDSIKQFGPEENQFFDGTAIQVRYL